jgi:hypothetical protein
MACDTLLNGKNVPGVVTVKQAFVDASGRSRWGNVRRAVLSGSRSRWGVTSECNLRVEIAVPRARCVLVQRYRRDWYIALRNTYGLQ